MNQNQSTVAQAVDALKQGARNKAVNLLQKDLAEGPRSGERWASVERLATQIGEIDIALEAARRFAKTQPMRLERVLHYWGSLAAHGRADLVVKEAAKLPDNVRAQSHVQHLLGTIATNRGDTEAAETHLRNAIKNSNFAPFSWFALAMIKTFSADDPDLAAMDALEEQAKQLPADPRSRFAYARAKAHFDAGNIDKAMELYGEGAALRRTVEKMDLDQMEKAVDALLDAWDSDAIKALTPSTHKGSRAIFVNGLPRSGTTLVDSLLNAHSKVDGGAEINLVRPALLPVGGVMPQAAKGFETRHSGDDPWGHLAEKYENLLEQRFGKGGHVVDKTLLQGQMVPLLFQMLPDARMIWLRRDPEDMAWSTYRNYFASPVPWSWSFEDIARYYKIEDRVHAKMAALFPEHILTVQYEELVQDPETWIGKILDHVGLEHEDGIADFHRADRDVQTASVAQVREPISASKIGQAKAIDTWLEPFRKVYNG
ncbi:tetratricopeptide repeat-containing sulfotransferase family protein [Sphingomicrobium sediminis]|uniref:Sulfotransferase n=1 Tax=Sphingomicrobium sediminis TaxID=2950949 RepID=A0A9X2J2I9_9SPHN|nr:tetratricopeptide repeat-containing sulfotransferase family protein [Sphingomicrobium sediminis]MCM8557829.1 sulfotransferase [Sphingomicrobium sediminis]